MDPLNTDGRALAGLRVLDFSIKLAGPYCARLQADLGADVIKIEAPEGDDMRLRQPLRGGHSAYFGQLNAGKRSLALDLKCPAAAALVQRLALCEVTQQVALRDDPRFASVPSRAAHWAAMMQIVELWTRQRSVADCLRLLEAAGVPCAPYNEPGDAHLSALRAQGVFGPA